MSTLQCANLSQKLQAVKDLYAELFALMGRSVREDPQVEGSGKLDGTIEQLQSTIERDMAEFRREVAQGRQSRTLGNALEAEILAFDGQLRQGLELMAAQVRRRSEELAAVRREMSERLMLFRRKRSGAKGYRRHIAPSVLLDSKV